MTCAEAKKTYWTPASVFQNMNISHASRLSLSFFRFSVFPLSTNVCSLLIPCDCDIFRHVNAKDDIGNHTDAIEEVAPRARQRQIAKAHEAGRPPLAIASAVVAASRAGFIGDCTDYCSSKIIDPVTTFPICTASIVNFTTVAETSLLLGALSALYVALSLLLIYLSSISGASEEGRQSHHNHATSYLLDGDEHRSQSENSIVYPSVREDGVNERRYLLAIEATMDGSPQHRPSVSLRGSQYEGA